MAEGGILGTGIGSGISLPSAGTVSSIAFWILLVVVIMVVLGILGYVFYLYTQYKVKLWVWGKVNGISWPIYRDRARIVPFGPSGDRVLITRKAKKYLPRPSLMTNGMYCYYITIDEEWVNFQPTDIDNVRKEMGIKITSQDMRLSRTAIEKNLRDRFIKPSFFEKYGAILITIILVVIVALIAVYIMNKAASIFPIAQQVSETNLKVVQSLDNLRSGGHLIPINGTG